MGSLRRISLATAHNFRQHIHDKLVAKFRNRFPKIMCSHIICIWNGANLTIYDFNIKLIRTRYWQQTSPSFRWDEQVGVRAECNYPRVTYFKLCGRYIFCYVLDKIVSNCNVSSFGFQSKYHIQPKPKCPDKHPHRASFTFWSENPSSPNPHNSQSKICIFVSHMYLYSITLQPSLVRYHYVTLISAPIFLCTLGTYYVEYGNTKLLCYRWELFTLVNFVHFFTTITLSLFFTFLTRFTFVLHLRCSCLYLQVK